MVTVTNTWPHVGAQTSDEVETRLSYHMLQAQLKFWESLAEEYRQGLENIALRAADGKPITVSYKGKSVELIKREAGTKTAEELGIA